MKILLVEDDPPTTELMTLRLEALGCEVLTASTAAAALEFAATQRPAFVLADLELPGGIHEGASLLDALAADPRTAGIPVYVHSVFVSHQADLQRLDTPARGILLKPLRVPDLRALIEAHQPPAALEAVAQHDPADA